MRLQGIRSDGLLGYLKGLGLLLILARQDDPQTTASWRDGVLVLQAERDLPGIEEFLLEKWRPAPVVSPWNGGSGFYKGDNRAAFEAIESSDDARLDPMRAAMAAGRRAVADLGLSATPEPKMAKPALLRLLRATLADDALEWLDAAVVQTQDGLYFPPALGSGGNDGRYDFANNYAQAVCHSLGLTTDRNRAETLESSLRGGDGGVLLKMSLAHLSRDASPVNSPAGAADALGNPWDLVFAVHGLLLFSAGAARRLGAARGGGAAPFTMRSTAAGYGSAVSGEKGRAELWMPLWSKPASLTDVQTLLREGRMQIGRRDAVTGFDALRAIGELGVARGVDGFERFVVLERAGQSNLTVPAGRIDVRPNSAAAALATLEPWLSRVLRYGAGDVPQRQRHAIRALQQASFALAGGAHPRAVVEILAAIGRVEVALSRAGGDLRSAGLRPLRADAAPWLDLLDAKRVEHRLAVAFASLADDKNAYGAVSVREALLGPDDDYGSPSTWRAPAAAPIVEQLSLFHERRWLTAGDGRPGFAYGLTARIDDLALLAAGATDDRELAALLPGLAALRWRASTPPLRGGARVAAYPDPLLALLVLAFHDPRLAALGSPDSGVGEANDGAERCTPGRGWVSLMRAGRVAAARDAAHLRLRLSGLAPIAHAGDLVAVGRDGSRLAAALLARPSRGDLTDLVASTTLTPTASQENFA